MIPETCSAAVFLGVGRPLEIQEFPLPKTIEPGAAICRVIMSTICGSDLHTISGRRTEPTPIILGHEIIGEIVALGDGLDRDQFGNELGPGERVTWSIMACCGDCFYCNRGLPQKCLHLRKYGHTCSHQPPYLTGGFAEYIYLFPGTAIFKVPDRVPDRIATPANCALATVINAAETIGLKQGETVLIQGAGLLGLNLVAIAVQTGARRIIVTDIDKKRLARASAFGAHLCLDAGELSNDQIVSTIRTEADGYGVDVAFEVCGAKTAVAQAADALRIGGRYLIAGLVTPDSDLGIDGNQVTRKYLTIKGIHNYAPRHLGQALLFLEKYAEKYPYRTLLETVFPLTQINEAIKQAETGNDIRVAVKVR